MPFFGGTSGGSGTPGGSSGQVQYNNAGSFAGATGFTLSAGALTALAIATGTITTSTPAIAASQTWNAGGVTFKALTIDVTDTASAAGSLLADFRVGGSSKASIDKFGTLTATTISSSSTVAASSGVSIRGGAGNFGCWSGGAFAWSSTSDGAGTNDLLLYRDAANTLALQNGTSAQTFNVYNTWSSAGANYERVAINWSANVAQIITQVAGTGTARAVGLVVGASVGVSPTSSTPFTWTVTSSGHLLGNADNAYDIGASGANRPRAIYVAGAGTFGGIVTMGHGVVGASGQLYWTGRSLLTSPSDGALLLQNNAGTDFGRLQFGGTTSSFPALKRSTTDIQVRLADDSGYAGMQLGATSAALKVGTHSAIAAETVTGYITIKDSGGTDRKIAVVS